MQDYNVIFLEAPTVGKPVKIRHLGQDGYSAIVTGIGNINGQPGLIRVSTRNGDACVGTWSYHSTYRPGKLLSWNTLCVCLVLCVVFFVKWCSDRPSKSVCVTQPAHRQQPAPPPLTVYIVPSQQPVDVIVHSNKPLPAAPVQPTESGSQQAQTYMSNGRKESEQRAEAQRRNEKYRDELMGGGDISRAGSFQSWEKRGDTWVLKKQGGSRRPDSGTATAGQ